MAARNSAPVAPSTTRWSQLIDRFISFARRISSPSKTGRSTILFGPMIATSGRLITGVVAMPPSGPSEVIVSVIRDGQLQRIPSTELVCGDLLVLSEGDAVGADARLVRAATLFVQEASLTGESEPVLKDAATLASAVSVADQRNMVFKGTAVVRGNGLALVTATGMDTQMGAIAALLERTEEDRHHQRDQHAANGRFGRFRLMEIGHGKTCGH